MVLSSGKDNPIFECGEGEMELGVGIHGEKGRRRAPLPKADAVVDELFEAVATDLPFERGDKVGLMITVWAERLPANCSCSTGALPAAPRTADCK